MSCELLQVGASAEMAVTSEQDNAGSLWIMNGSLQVSINVSS